MIKFLSVLQSINYSLLNLDKIETCPDPEKIRTVKRNLALLTQINLYFEDYRFDLVDTINNLIDEWHPHSYYDSFIDKIYETKQFLYKIEENAGHNNSIL